MYHEQDFIDAGIDHIEAFFLDGSCPSMEILQTVLAAFENVPADKAFAVHCKAGLGRTGSCIGAYLMKHYGFTAKEAIAWMRICRPGCVIGPQQQYLEKIQRLMWEEGAAAGYIELPAGADSPVVKEKEQDSDMTEAVEGRAGQAEALLAARSRRQGTDNKIITTSPSTVPMTPDSKEKSPVATVTPDHATNGVVNANNSALWCG